MKKNKRFILITLALFFIIGQYALNAQEIPSSIQLQHTKLWGNPQFIDNHLPSSLGIELNCRPVSAKDTMEYALFKPEELELPSCFGQTLTQEEDEKQKVYYTWITMMDSGIKKKGRLYSVNATSIRFVKNTSYRINYTGEYVNINQIELIQVRRKGNVGKGALIGGICGMLVGTIVGFRSASSSTSSGGLDEGATALFTGIAFAIPCAAIGCVFGAKRTKFRIEGKQEQFDENKNKLKEYSIK